MEVFECHAGVLWHVGHQKPGLQKHVFEFVFYQDGLPKIRPFA